MEDIHASQSPPNLHNIPVRVYITASLTILITVIIFQSATKYRGITYSN